MSRSPHGEHGLKFFQEAEDGVDAVSLPARGAWIEIALSINLRTGANVAPRTGSMD